MYRQKIFEGEGYVSIFDFLRRKKSSLAEDIIKAYKWIAKALGGSGYKADFSIESLKEIDTH